MIRKLDERQYRRPIGGIGLAQYKENGGGFSSGS
jgi:hypothetical protein